MKTIDPKLPDNQAIAAAWIFCAVLIRAIPDRFVFRLEENTARRSMFRLMRSSTTVSVVERAWETLWRGPLSDLRF